MSQHHNNPSPVAAPPGSPDSPPWLQASVVVPVRGRSDDLIRCVECLINQDFPADSYEILVCDDGSSAADAAEIRQFCESHATVRYLRQDPKGPAAARNLGIANAKAPIVAFTDSDTLPTRGWLAAILEPFSDPEVVAVEGPVRTPRPAESPLEEAPRNEGGVHLTANMAYRRQVLLDVGGLDEEFPLAAFEDVDLALSVRGRGHFAWAPNAVVMHPWRRVTLKSSLRRLKQLDWLLVTALRHGCLGWENRPTRYPRLRIALAAACTLPLGRVRKGLTYLFRSPADAAARIGISLIECVVSLSMAPRWLWGAFPVQRGRYLDGAAR